MNQRVIEAAKRNTMLTESLQRAKNSVDKYKQQLDKSESDKVSLSV